MAALIDQISDALAACYGVNRELGGGDCVRGYHQMTPITSWLRQLAEQIGR